MIWSILNQYSAAPKSQIKAQHYPILMPGISWLSDYHLRMYVNLVYTRWLENRAASQLRFLISEQLGPYVHKVLSCWGSFQCGRLSLSIAMHKIEAHVHVHFTPHRSSSSRQNLGLIGDGTSYNTVDTNLGCDIIGRDCPIVAM